MHNPADFIKYGAIAAGLFVILGGMLFRKTYATVRNIALSPLMGFFPFLAATSAQAASGLVAELAGLANQALGSGGAFDFSRLDPGFGAMASDRLFPFSAILSAVFLGISIYFPLRSAFLLRIYSMAVSAFVATLGLLAALALFNVKLGSLAILAVFLSAAVLLGCLEKFDFDIVLIVETSIVGSLLLLSPARARFDLNIFVHLFFAVLFLAVFIILDLMVLKRRNAPQT